MRDVLLIDYNFVTWASRALEKTEIPVESKYVFEMILVWCRLRSLTTSFHLSWTSLYYFSLFRAPLSIRNDLESVTIKFFWGGDGENRKMSWVKWEKVLNSFQKEREGGVYLS